MTRKKLATEISTQLGRVRARPVQGTRMVSAREAGVVKDVAAPKKWLALAATLPGAPDPKAPIFDTWNADLKAHTGIVSMTIEGLEQNFRKLREAEKRGELKGVQITDPMDPGFLAHFQLLPPGSSHLPLSAEAKDKLFLGQHGVRGWFSARPDRDTALVQYKGRPVGFIRLAEKGAGQDLNAHEKILGQSGIVSQVYAVEDKLELEPGEVSLQMIHRLTGHDVEAVVGRFGRSDEFAPVMALVDDKKQMIGKLWRPDAPIMATERERQTNPAQAKAYMMNDDEPWYFVRRSNPIAVQNLAILTGINPRIDPNKPVVIGPYVAVPMAADRHVQRSDIKTPDDLKAIVAELPTPHNSVPMRSGHQSMAILLRPDAPIETQGRLSFTEFRRATPQYLSLKFKQAGGAVKVGGDQYGTTPPIAFAAATDYQLTLAKQGEGHEPGS